ncbi:MAG: hypothetical protein OEY49_09585 [Candidatus Heimdallarchaeota archaeon]|nr:hypothetical protein [Candidatus Heimdallarchaeota archaeon]
MSNLTDQLHQKYIDENFSLIDNSTVEKSSYSYLKISTKEDSKRLRLIKYIKENGTIKINKSWNLYSFSLDQLEAIIEFGDPRAFVEQEYDYRPSFYNNNDFPKTSYEVLYKSKNTRIDMDKKVAFKLGGFTMMNNISKASPVDTQEKQRKKLLSILNTLPYEYKQVINEIDQIYLDNFLDLFHSNYQSTQIKLLVPLIIEIAKSMNLVFHNKEISKLLNISNKGYLKNKQTLIDSGILNLKHNQVEGTFNDDIFETLKISSINRLYHLLQNNILEPSIIHDIRNLIDDLFENLDIMEKLKHFEFKDYIIPLVAIYLVENFDNKRRLQLCKSLITDNSIRYESLVKRFYNAVSIVTEILDNEVIEFKVNTNLNNADTVLSNPEVRMNNMPSNNTCNSTEVFSSINGISDFPSIELNYTSTIKQFNQMNLLLEKTKQSNIIGGKKDLISDIFSDNYTVNTPQSSIHPMLVFSSIITSLSIKNKDIQKIQNFINKIITHNQKHDNSKINSYKIQDYSGDKEYKIHTKFSNFELIQCCI